MHGVHMLAKVEWDDRKFIVAGLAMLVALGGHVRRARGAASHAALGEAAHQQPVISGGLTLVILHSLLCGVPAEK